jgi:hypothetical protein
LPALGITGWAVTASPAPPLRSRTVTQRLAANWAGLLYVAVFAWLDWISHRDLLFLIVGVAMVVAVLFSPEILAEASRASGGRYAGLVGRIQGFRTTLQQIPPVLRPFLSAVPGLLYLLLRGSGTAPPEMGVSVAVVVIGLLVVATVAETQLDRRLQPWYFVRSRVPRAIRFVVAPVIAIALAFLIVHQNLGDLPAVIGGSTSSPRSPADVSVVMFVIAAALSAIASYLLLHEPADGVPASGGPATSAGGVASTSQVAPEVRLAKMIAGWTRGPAWVPTHRVAHAPLTGHPAERAAPGIDLPPETEITQLAAQEGWALIATADDWRGWVAAAGIAPIDAVQVTPTSRVSATDADAWRADGPVERPLKLAPGSTVAVTWVSGPWSMIVADDHWRGWLNTTSLEPLS